MTVLLERPTSHAGVDVPRDHPAVATYEGTVRHRRFVPTLREFAPKLFLAYLDIDALPGSLDRLPLWSARRPAPVRFRPRDFLDGTDRPLGAAVRDLVQARLGRRPTGPVRLLAQLRTFGWLFNPLAVYYCWTPDGRALDAIVLEVTNTPWHERHWYVLDAQDHTTTTTTAKAMHVSPFLATDLDYRITWTVPNDDLNLRIEVERDRTPIFDAELELRRTPISRGARSPCWRATRCCRNEYRQASLRTRRSSSHAGFPCSGIRSAGGREQQMTTTSAPERLARAVVRQLLKRLAGGTVHLIDPVGDARFGDATAPRTSPPIDVTVHVRDSRVYSRILQEGSVGLGESYADGWWETDDLSGFLRLAHRSLARTHTARDRMHRLLRPVVDPVARRRSPDKDRDTRNVRAHYDLGNEFFQRILDDTMMYSCAVFERPTDSLAEASVQKLDRLANLLALAPGDRVLEIGTGWGGFAVHAATHYGCHVTTTTISRRQYEFAQQRVRNAGLEDRVTILADHYRDIGGTFDKIIAIEMIEAVDWREYDNFFAHCRRLLDDAGALGDAGNRRARRQLRPHQAPRRLHQDRDLPRWLPTLGPSAHGERTPHGVLTHPRRRHRAALRRDAAPLENEPHRGPGRPRHPRPRRAIRATLGVLLLLLRGRVRRTLRSRRAVAVHRAGMASAGASHAAERRGHSSRLAT